MSAALGTFQNTASPGEVKIRLNFFKKLQAVTNKIHATCAALPEGSRPPHRLPDQPDAPCFGAGRLVQQP